MTPLTSIVAPQNVTHSPTKSRGGTGFAPVSHLHNETTQPRKALATLAIATLVFTLLLVQGVYGQTLLDSLLAYYPFNGNAMDESGNGHHATVYGATLTEDRFGRADSAYLFDGVDDYMNIGNANGLKPQLPVTIAAWVQFSGTGNPIFMNNYIDNAYFGVWLYQRGPQGTVMVSYGDGGGISPQSRRAKFGTTALQDGTWYHIAGVIRGESDMDIYVNGVNDGGTYGGTGGALTYNSGSGNVGRQDFANFGPPNFATGAIDDIYFYSRALTEIEVQALRDSGVLAPPLTLEPERGAVDVPLSTEMRWSSVENTLSYSLQVSRSPAFSSLLVDESGLADTTATVSGLDPLRVHYWRVRGANATGESDWSETSFFTTRASGIGNESAETIGLKFALHDAHPNPFGVTTTIPYEVERISEIRIGVYDVLSRQVGVLVSGTRAPGTYEVTFNASDLPSGIYFYRLEAGDYVETKRMVVVK